MAERFYSSEDSCLKKKFMLLFQQPHSIGFYRRRTDRSYHRRQNNGICHHRRFHRPCGGDILPRPAGTLPKNLFGPGACCRNRKSYRAPVLDKHRSPRLPDRRLKVHGLYGSYHRFSPRSPPRSPRSNPPLRPPPRPPRSNPSRPWPPPPSSGRRLASAIRMLLPLMSAP